MNAVLRFGADQKSLRVHILETGLHVLRSPKVEQKILGIAGVVSLRHEVGALALERDQEVAWEQIVPRLLPILERKLRVELVGPTVEGYQKRVR